MARVLDWIFFLFFFSHIFITILFDSQGVFPEWLYPQVLLDIMRNYCVDLKDALMFDPPIWFQSFVYCEMAVQFPFFFVASYAFYKGGCKWIRIPAIVYATHVSTTMVPILAHILLYDFDSTGPATMNERLTICAIYCPYLIVPLLLLFTMLFGSEYQADAKVKTR